VIKSFAHKGLEDFFLYGVTKEIQAKHVARLEGLLDRLDAAIAIKALGFPSSGLHKFKRALQAHWAVKASDNWRLTFRFEAGDAHVVDYQDYH